MKVRSILGHVVAGALVALVGCSNGAQPGSDADVGSVGVALELSPGLTLGSVSYTVTGPASFSRTATVDVSHSTTISFVVAGLPAAAGYQVAISGSLSDGLTTCMGSAPFAVTAHQTSTVAVGVRCLEPATTGSARINGTLNVCPVADGLSASPSEIAIGNAITLVGAAHDTDHAPAALTYAWTATGGMVMTPAASTTSFICTTVGTVTITLTVSDGDCSDALTQTVVCSAGPTGAAGTGVAGTTGAAGTGVAGTTGAAGAAGTSPFTGLVINEIESNGDPAGDFVELYNTTASPINLSGLIFMDADPRTFAIPAGTSIAAGGYYVLSELGTGGFNFGLGAADSARLFLADGVTLVVSQSWTAHAPTTFGRCPNGTGAFGNTVTSTKGAANDCGGGTGAAGTSGAAGTGAAGTGVAGTTGAAGTGLAGNLPWPGANMTVTVDELNAFSSNLSGLNYQPAAGGSPAVLWAVLNSPSTIYKLVWNGTTWTSTAADGWGAGKTLRYPSGAATLGPDSEGLSKTDFASSAMYVSAERDNAASGVSRLSILRFDTDAAGAFLTATNEWNLTADLPVVGANLGLEDITWVPDATLVASGFVDELTGLPYVPSQYANHGGGIFFVGVEGTGSIYGYALDHTANTFTRVATIASGQAGVMGMHFDRETGYLWAYCDNTCGNKSSILEIDASVGPTHGKFQLRRLIDHGSSLPDSNNEGITIAPESECVAGQKPIYWSDDSNFASHAIRRDSIPCGHFAL